MKPALVQRAAEAGDDLVADLERPPGLLVDDQVGVALAEAGVGVGEARATCRAAGARPWRAARTARPSRDSSPLRVVITVPCTPTQSPRSRSSKAANASSPTTAFDTNSWISPVAVAHGGEDQLALSRMSIDAGRRRRPAPRSRCRARAPPCAARSSARVWRAVEAVRVGVGARRPQRVDLGQALGLLGGQALRSAVRVGAAVGAGAVGCAEVAGDGGIGGQRRRRLRAGGTVHGALTLASAAAQGRRAVRMTAAESPGRRSPGGDVVLPTASAT